jgi:hypothetical protein
LLEAQNKEGMAIHRNLQEENRILKFENEKLKLEVARLSAEILALNARVQRLEEQDSRYSLRELARAPWREGVGPLHNARRVS